MSTDIQWTDETWNPVTGCTKVSPGCAHCYAEGVAERFWASQYPPVEYQSYSVDACCPITEMRARQFTDVQTHADRLDQPLHWQKPRRVFVNSMSDLFHEDVPDEFINVVYTTMEQRAPQHIYQVLTKRADRMQKYLEWRYGPREDGGGYRIPARHIWHGVSVENEEFLSRIDRLKDTRSSVRFVSFEPLLKDLGAVLLDRIHWTIIGGESGPGARPCSVWSIRHLARQCRDAGVPVFVKQLGAHVITRNDDGFEGDSPCSWPMDTRYDELPGHPGWQGDPVRVRLRDRKGGDMNEWPEDLRVREFPTQAP